jgi:hypothetical protein
MGHKMSTQMTLSSRPVLCYDDHLAESMSNALLLIGQLLIASIR